MNAFPLFMADGRRAGPWACGACRVVHVSEATAASCCEPASCADCGSATDKGRTRCRECVSARSDARDQAQWDKARKIQPAEYTGNLVWCDNLDKFFGSVASLVDEWLDEEYEGLPRVYACRPFGLRWDAVRILEGALDGHHDGAGESIPDGAVAELQAALDGWAERFGPKSYEPDHGVAIVVDPSTFYGRGAS